VVPTPGKSNRLSPAFVLISPHVGCFVRFYLLSGQHVQSLLPHPGNTFVGYYTYDEAMEEYNSAKEAGRVEVVRDDEDDLIFGPMEDAIM